MVPAPSLPWLEFPHASTVSFSGTVGLVKIGHYHSRDSPRSPTPRRVSAIGGGRLDVVVSLSKRLQVEDL
jgi:hypothetical protein